MLGFLERGRRQRTRQYAEEPWVGVIGPGDSAVDSAVFDVAQRIGEELARVGATVVNGGKGGVMLAAARGARCMGGRAYGFLPSLERREGNAFLTRIIPTGLGEARNFAVVGASEALISVGDNEGTRIETNIALKAGKRVYGLLTDYRPDHELFEPVDSGRPSSHVVQLSVQAAEDWRARSHSPRSLDAVHDATEGSRPAETTAVSSQQRIESLWRSYDSAQRHYEKDLDLFVTRMNLFILVVAGFAALDRSKAMVDSGSAVAGLGLALSVCWLGLWGSSYYWILEWRDELVAIGRRIEGMTCVAPAALNRFGDTRARGRPKKALVNLSRPTGLTLALPLVFCIYWSAGLVQFL